MIIIPPLINPSFSFPGTTSERKSALVRMWNTHVRLEFLTVVSRRILWHAVQLGIFQSWKRTLDHASRYWNRKSIYRGSGRVDACSSRSNVWWIARGNKGEHDFLFNCSKFFYRPESVTRRSKPSRWKPRWKIIPKVLDPVKNHPIGSWPSEKKHPKGSWPGEKKSQRFLTRWKIIPNVLDPVKNHPKGSWPGEKKTSQRYLTRWKY